MGAVLAPKLFYMQPEYSFVIPVFNRPEEIRELLQSMCAFTSTIPFEVLIIEDGSSLKSDVLIHEFQEKLNIRYFFKENSGPGDSRNFGMRRANSEYFIILDSDVILPENYLFEVNDFLKKNPCDCFGGPDAAHPSFTAVQKAIDFSMTSVYTTGGIRGGRKAVDEFQPRSFNMGIRKDAFMQSGGFGNIHPGEDPDLSLRLKKLGYRICLIPEAKVFHKRRIDWNKFFAQVHKFGLVRPILNKWHSRSAKITYWFPLIFIIGIIFAFLALSVRSYFIASIYVVYFLIIFIDASIKNKSIYIGLLAIKAVIIQFLGYGTGFLRSQLMVNVLGKDPEKAFPKLFFKS